eukprot:gnl/MRDRNA2_/MRDRNA2_410722_c0_seq1.p1 gnl/MRDRNA2_/MRDRNA2_410722_c0~~gnl/MRDRNA2_/MRDRNA2_410722_c0_seq1.p1  ORF type:complete len:132 (+),score=27.81 gnl/MRDRNA2_/MRDRNA2_410722_c0_seq1:111-506(+)
MPKMLEFYQRGVMTKSCAAFAIQNEMANTCANEVQAMFHCMRSNGAEVVPWSHPACKTNEAPLWRCLASVAATTYNRCGESLEDEKSAKNCVLRYFKDPTVQLMRTTEAVGVCRPAEAAPPPDKDGKGITF